MAEEFALYQLGGNGGAVDLHIWHHRTLALLMKGPCYQFLSGAVRSHYKYAGIGGCHFLHHLTNVLDALGLPYHLLAVYLFLEQLCLAHEAGLVGGVLQGDQDAVQVQRLFYEVIGTFLYAVHCSGNIGVAGYHYHRRLYPFLHQTGEHFGTVHLGHLDIAEDSVVFFLFGLLKALLAVFGHFYLIGFHFQDLFQGVADGTFVVYNQDSHSL